eukprot:XP_003962306.1 PREDICTED: A-kinase anchor protein 12-like [Takifugu rubripes]
MGDVQSTQRGSRQDAAAEEESRDANHPQTEQNTDHENSEQTSDFSRKGDEVKMNGCCEDENGAQGLPLIPTKEAAPDTQGNKEELQREGDNDGMHLEITEMDVKQNEMNPFGRIFSNIGLKLTINRGLGEMARNDGKRINTEKSEQTKTEKTEDKAEGQTVQEGSDPACSILTGVTSSEVLGGSDKTVKAAEEPEGEADSVAGTQEDEPHSTNSSGPGDVEIDSPIRKFFATGSFAGLWKKKEPDDEPTEKELEEVGGSQAIETTGQTVQEQHEGKVTPPGEHKENELRGEMLAKTPECDILSSQERDRVQMSPLLRFLSGSSLKRLSMKQRNVKSSEARLCDSGEHPPELLPSDPAEDHRNASSPTSAEAAKEEEGPWASFKRFMSPKPRMKKSYHSAEETQQPAPVEELKAEQTFDHSSEEGKKRKNSSVSWEAVLCGSGRRRSRKTSDSEDEMPPIDLKHRKEDAGAKSGGESGAENEKETSSSFKQDGTLQEGDGGSAWKSLKRIVTPKRKSRDEDERMKINIQPDAECAEENSSFSIKNLLQGRKKQRSEESQGPVSSGESRKGLASDDEDTETPGVVPLSEFEVDEEEKESLDEGEKSELQKEQVAHMNLCFPQDFNEASEKQEDANKGPDEVTKPGGKHQQLSDIQEEGVNTEPGVTVTSVLEEVEVRDDAMAEDLIEVASEAFTALEPAADITLQDETEMFTAVSQFSSESAKTSGNATPVPAESDIIETDTLLHQVAETFMTDPKTTTPKPEQIFEAFVEKDSAVHELQRRPGATPNETGLNVKDLETISRLVSASLREGVSKVAEVNSAGFVPTEELDRAETTLEDVRVINVTQKSTNDNEKNIPVSPVEQVEVKSVMDDCQEPVLTSAIGATIEKGDLEQEVQTLTENGDLTKHGIPDHPEDEDEKQPSAEVEGVRDPAEALASGGVVELGEHADMLSLTEETVVQEPEETEDPAEGHVPSHEPNVISDNISMCSGIETGGDKPEAEPRLLTEAIVEQLDASKSVEEPEDLQAEQASSSKLQEGNMSLDEPQIVSENLARADADKDEADKTQVLTETLELMEAPQETEVLQAVQERSANGDVIVLLLETELIPEKGSKAEDEFEPQGLLKPATEADISQPYQASSEMSAEINDSDQIVQLQELNNSTDLTEDALGALEVKASKTVEEPEVLQTASSLGSDKGNITSVETNEKPDTIPKEELHLDENEKETINTEDTIESMEASTIAQEPEVIKPPALASEDIVLPPETVIILKADLDTDEHKTQSTLITEEAADAPKVEEPELAQSVQPSPLESEESIGGPLEREITSDNISEEQTTTDDPPGETIIEAVDDSKTQILEELQTVQTSSLVREESSISPYETEETSDGTLTAEGHIAENKEDTMLHTDYSIESEDEVKVLQEAEELKIVFETSPDEPEDVKSVATEILFEKEHFKTVQTSSFVSEEISIPSIDPEGTSENLLKADLETEEHKMQTNLVTEDTSELLDDPHSVEEAELSPPVQPSCEESENIHDPLLEAEAISHNTPKAETVQEETNEEIILDHVSEEERVPEEPIEEGHTNLQSEDPSETVQEAKALQALQQSLASEETEEATSANLTEEETVHSELKAETPVAAETISESGDESNAAETVEELHTVQTSSLVSEEHSIPALEAEESSENLHGAESDSDEHKVEMVLVPGDTSAPKTPEVPELSQTVQMCSLALGDNETSSDEPEKTSEVILKGETRPDKPRAETTVAGKTINEPENESKTAEVIEELKTVETSPLVSENSSKSTLKAEDTFEEISEVQPDTVENQVEPVLVTVETSQPKTAEEPEPSLQLTVQSSSLESEDNNIPSAEPEMTSEIICKEETVPDEPKEELKLHSEKPLEPEDPSEAVGGAEASSAVNPQSESEEIKLETSDNISEEERVTDEPRDETTLVIETSMEPVDESKYAEQVEELQILQISSVVKEESRISLYEPEDSSENTLNAQIDVDENKVETCLDAKETSELIPPKEPESSLQVTVQSSSLESEDNNIPSAEPEITSEIIHKEETVPDELEPESKTAEVLEEQQTVQTSSLVEYKSIIPPLEAEEPSDNIPKAEIVLEEPEEEITLDPENTKTAEEPQALTAEPPTPEAEPPSLGNRATCDHFPAEETVPDEPKEETITETLDASEPVQELELIQEVLVPSLASDELEGKSNNGAEAETDTVLLSQVHHKPGDVHKPEVLEPVQAVSLESVAASDETQATSEKIPEAETNPEDEDLRVETAADELNLHHPIKLVEPEEDLPVEEARTGPDHTAEVPLDKSESEDHVGETSEHKPETVLQDDQIKHEGSTPEEFQTLTAGQISEEPVVSVETRHLSEEQAITVEVKGDKYLGTETETAEDEDPAAPQIDKCHPEEGGPDILMGQTSQALMEEEDEAAPPTVRDGVAEDVKEGKAEDEDAAEIGEVDVDIKSEGTPVDWLQEADRTEAMEVCSSVPPTVSVTEEEERKNVDSKGEETVEGRSSRGELDPEVKCLTPGFGDEELCDVSSGQQESKHLIQEIPGCLESTHEDPLDEHDRNEGEVKEKESVEAKDASPGPPGTKKEAVDQDEEMDGDVQKETAGSFDEVEEPLESQRGDEDMECAGLEETTQASRVGEESGERNRAEGACRSEREGNDFDVAPEHPGNTSTTTVSLTG